MGAMDEWETGFIEDGEEVYILNVHGGKINNGQMKLFIVCK